jgi:hypothetical protein
MRIWDIPPTKLCRKHLLGEHRELHAIWTILTTGKKGYRHHPETKRWIGKLHALYVRHEKEVQAMKKRNYVHNSPLDQALAIGAKTQKKFVHSIEEQKKILQGKECGCFKTEK